MKENSDDNPNPEYFAHLRKIKLFNPPLDLSLSPENSYSEQKYKYLLFSYRNVEKIKNTNQGFLLLFNKKQSRVILKVVDDSLHIKISDLKDYYGTDNIVNVMGFNKSENVEIVEASNEKNSLQNIEHSQGSGTNKSPDIVGCIEELKVNAADINVTEETKKADAKKEDKYVQIKPGKIENERKEVSEINKNPNIEGCIEELIMAKEKDKEAAVETHNKERNIPMENGNIDQEREKTSKRISSQDDGKKGQSSSGNQHLKFLDLTLNEGNIIPEDQKNVFLKEVEVLNKSISSNLLESQIIPLTSKVPQNDTLEVDLNILDVALNKGNVIPLKQKKTISDEVEVEQSNAEVFAKKYQKNNMQEIRNLIPSIYHNITLTSNLMELPKVTQEKLQSLCKKSNPQIKNKEENSLDMKKVI